MSDLPVSLIMQVLDAELKWCLEHEDRAFTAEYRKGFRNGLIQAKHLIAEANRALKDEGEKQ